MRAIVISCLLLTLLISGCTRTRTERGIEPTWRDLETSSFVAGETTQAEVLERLGPPSQVITHDTGDVFYYLHEEARTRGLVLILYNTSQTDTTYDRAIFFFDSQGTLTDFAISRAADDEP